MNIWNNQSPRQTGPKTAERTEKIATLFVKRPDEQKGFVVLSRRLAVEGTFGWFGRYRHLSKNYEGLPASCEALILIAMINLMVHRLEPDLASRAVSKGRPPTRAPRRRVGKAVEV